MKAILALSLGLFLCVNCAGADGEQRESDGTANQQAAGDSKRTVVPKLDKRLPPVLPGQVVEVDGQKIKVWSSAGPVPVGNPPEPWREYNSRSYLDIPGGVDVIVDDRKGHHRPRGEKRPARAK